MGSGVTVVRIVVAQPPILSEKSDTVVALGHLGADVAIDFVETAEECRRATEDGGVDLVVADHALGDEAFQILAAHRTSGPPVVVVVRRNGEDAALDAFRRGAADCIHVGPDYADVLPVVALEQVRRWRQVRERGASERRIRELQRYNENIIQNMNSALVVVDTEGHVTSANPSAEAILGVSPGGLLGRGTAEWLRADESGGSLISRTLEQAVRFTGAETALTHQSGRIVPVGMSCSPLLDGDGSQLGAVAIFQDLTEMKLLESQVLQSEKMASIGELAAGVAHEINNPMGFIHANLQQMSEYMTDLRQVWSKTVALQEAADSGDPDEFKRASQALRDVSSELDIDFVYSDFSKALRESQEGSERIRHIVQDLRDFSHRDTGELLLSDINQALDSTASIVWTMMKHTVVLKKDYGDIPQVRCYPMQLKQVFMNLLVNAYQAIEQKIGQLDKCDGSDESEASERVEIRTHRSRGGVCVSILDTGVGIEPDDISRIFDPFFTTKEVGAGTGLGLSMSYNIIQRHGGTIHAESKPGEGSLFEVWLPEDGREEPSDGRPAGG